jgi:hypothetical protein
MFTWSHQSEVASSRDSNSKEVFSPLMLNCKVLLVNLVDDEFSVAVAMQSQTRQVKLQTLAVEAQSELIK